MCLGDEKDVTRLGNIRTSSVQFSSVSQLCLTLWDPMNRGTPGLPVHYQLLEFTEIHVHRVIIVRLFASQTAIYPLKGIKYRDFSGSLVVKTLYFQYKRHGFSPWLGNKDPTCCGAKKINYNFS